MNRVLNAIAKLEAKFPTIDPAALAKCEASATIDFEEWVAFNNARAMGQAMQDITFEESVTLASIIGEHTPDTFKAATLAERIIAMQMCTELMGRQIGRRATAVA